MSALVDLIKRIGIFMIAAQAVIHFTPGPKYEKYMKLIVSMMILMQFLTPVYNIFLDAGEELQRGFVDLQPEYQEGDMTGAKDTVETLIDSMESEIKSKLNIEAAEEDYQIVNVRVSLTTLPDKDENGITQYTLEKVRSVVMKRMRGEAGDGGGAEAIESIEEKADSGDGTENGGIDKIQIEKIQIGEVREQEEEIVSSGMQTTDMLRERFCGVLGIEEKYVEVSLYGTVEETAE